ncbi:MAG: fad-dependent pyridine nucleotide-disulfide oxidoreductase [Bacteroidetes bacterium]|nr:MAG: fad-dependent pyridine nucleotide-disulfide oxidoreductase [Bacteroidota bacterium]
MELLIENILVYALTILFSLAIVVLYFRNQKKKSKKIEEKIAQAKIDGMYEPVSLHPVIDVNSCIRTGACVAACPEKDILGIVNGKATTINASHCVGHGACFHACPTEAITLCIGTEKRGVELPHVNQAFESNVPGIYIAGELGGMGLIKNAVEQGKQAVENIAKNTKLHHNATYDLIVIGAGPAGISATLTAKKLRLNCLTLEQDTLGGTVFTFPRSKIVMTSAMDLPLYGKVKLFETSKSELLNIWNEALSKNEISIQENTKVENIIRKDDHFEVETMTGELISGKNILLAIGRRGTPRKLGVPGEIQEKVAYRLLEPEGISHKDIVVVGGGDSAVESALLLADQNNVILSYRSEAFSRLKPKNSERILDAAARKKVQLWFNTNIIEIGKENIKMQHSKTGEFIDMKNDLVFIFAGGELPTQFLMKAGIQITKKFGEAILKHN